MIKIKFEPFSLLFKKTSSIPLSTRYVPFMPVMTDEPLGHITNFKLSRRHVYETAVADFGDKDFEVCDGDHTGARKDELCSLWYHGPKKDLSDFWAFFRSIDGNTNYLDGE